jgi:GAF domain-containing protein
VQLVEVYQAENPRGQRFVVATVVGQVADGVDDDRWPDWAEEALGVGVHSCVSVGLPLHNGACGALTVYAPAPNAFDDETVALIQTFACYAAMAMANAHLHPGGVTPASVIRAEVATLTVTEQAVGVVMADRHCTAEQAAAVLAAMSRETGDDIAAVAARVVADVQTRRR